MALFITNTNLINSLIKQEFQLPKTANIRLFLSKYLKDLNHTTALIKIIVAGNRILNSHNLEEIAKIANGRNIRIYYALKKNNKIKINYIKYQIKKLNNLEENFLKENWNIDFFETLGKKFIIKINGANLENILYNYNL